MMPVEMPAPPPEYEARVRTPGNAFLASNPHPTRRDWNDGKYWTQIHDTLYSNLSGICSYCATYTPRRRTPGAAVGQTSIDHFVPKSKAPSLAYEWSNFRLCRAKLNNRKDEHEDVVDPYALVDGWFRLSFTKFLLYPDPGLSDGDRQKVESTIARLKLNEDDNLVRERTLAVYAYADKKLLHRDLERYYPFIAKEMTIQRFEATQLPKFLRLLAKPSVRSWFAKWWSGPTNA